MEELSIIAYKKAGDYFKEGFNCAESIVKTFNELCYNPMEAEIVRIATGFGGGLGHAGCMCGALAGSIMILGILKGRNNITESKEPTYELTKEFHDRFKLKFGATCCRILNPYKKLDSPEHLQNCVKITGNTAKLLIEFLKEKNLDCL
ncbi:C-GCAxxG-C-C family (seleno)protein [Desulfitobacterium sp. AusDCA]|uniref:C-GCAxxG-C-C family (seleno)protein n=1 Tax=Desulfitobacterium sp. AusDCA TaxID=3240383 RepID=UPI003DA71F06